MRSLLAASILICLTMSSYGQLRQNYNVIKIKPWDKALCYKVMTDSEVKAFQKEITAESRLATKALQEAQQQWRTQERYKGKSFPRRVSSKPTFSKVGSYDQIEKAQTKCNALETRRDDKAADERQAHINRKKGRSKAENAREAATLAATATFYATARSTYEAALEKVAADRAARTK
jgi:hypothetical protein